MTNEKIGALPFYSLLFLSVMSGVLLYVSDSPAELTGTDAVLRPLVFGAVNLAASAPLFLLLRVLRGRSPAALRECSPRFTRGVYAVYAAVYTATALRTAARFDLFAGSELFPEKRMTSLVLLLVAVCAVLGGADFAGMARAALPVAALVTAAAVAVGLLLLPQVELLRFSPPFENGFSRFLTDSLSSSLFAVEVGTLPLFFGSVKGDLIKGYYRGLALVTLLFTGVTFVVRGALGAFADAQLFPTYTAVTLAEVGSFKRLDSIETAIWVSCVLFKLVFFFCVAGKSLAVAFPRLPRRAGSLLSGTVVALCLLLLTPSVPRVLSLSSLPFMLVCYAVPTVALPCLLMARSKVKGGVVYGTSD